MFNAAWTDAPPQTIAQRKQRKRQDHDDFIAPSTRSSRSSESKAPQLRPSVFTVFNETKQDVLQPPSRAATRREHTERRFSSCTVSSLSSSPEFRAEGLTPRIARREQDNSFTARHFDSDQSEVPESVFSDHTALSADSEASHESNFHSITKSEIVQPLSPSSFVTRSTEVVVSSSSSIRASEQYAAVVHISAEGCPIEALGSPNKTPLFSAFNASDDNSSWKETLRTDGWLSKGADAWHPPEAWECTPEGATLEGSLGAPFHLPKSSVEKEKVASPPFELTHLQRSIRRMEAASPKIALERLKEEWHEVQDVSDYRELELEKQLWMLSALRTLNRLKIAETPGGPPIAERPSTSAKALSLYESHASASFLSALLPHIEIHHISTSPLSPRNYPNIHPIEVPNRTPQLPYASKIFTSIHGFTIPALLPASSIPILLKECHRTLTSNPTISPSPASSAPKRNGSLHLTLLDPSPLPATLGPLLRAWLDRHLILNLEKQFRCLNPMRLFPLWLADAGLRAQGSTITSVRFLASVPPGLRLGKGLGEGSGEAVRQELKSILGRMLWREMWGAFVQGKRWWWEDEGVVEECERLGTVWEYAIVQAVKEG